MFRPTKWMFFLIILAGVLLRISNWGVTGRFFDFTSLSGRLIFLDTDAYYQLRRLVYFIANFPHALVFDTLSDWPQGGFVDWPDGFIWLMGTPLRLLGVSDFSRLELGVVLLVLSLGILACVGVFFLSQTVFKSRNLAYLSLLFAATNLLMVRTSSVGYFDHHLLEVTLPIFLYFLYVKTLESPSKVLRFLLGLIQAYAISVSSSAIFYLAAFYGVLIFSRQRMSVLTLLGLYFALGIIIYREVLLTGQLFSINRPSLFQLIFVLMFTSVSHLLALRRYIFCAALLLSSFGLMFIWDRRWLFILQSAFNYVNRDGGLGYISEASSPFAQISSVDYFIFTYFGPLIALPLINFIPSVWKSQSRNGKGLLLFTVFLFIPAVYQRRFSYFFIGPYLCVLAFSIQVLVEMVFRRVGERLNIRYFYATALLLNAISLTGLEHATIPSIQTLNHDLVVEEFTKLVPINEQARWKRLSGRESVADGVWALHNLGHMLLYRAGFPAVSNSFYHDSAMDLDIGLRTETEDVGLLNLLREKRIRFGVLGEDWVYLQDQMRLRGLSDDGFFKVQRFRLEDGSWVERVMPTHKSVLMRIIMGEQIAGFKELSRLRTQIYDLTSNYLIIDFSPQK